MLGLLVSGLANTGMMAAHYRLSKYSLPTPFSADNLRYVQPIEALALLALALAVWAEGWGFALGALPVLVALFDATTVLRGSESQQFASVLLEMASELVVIDDQLAPLVRRTWVVFIAHNVWLFAWTSVFVDVARNQDHMQPVLVLFLLFTLFWSTQVFRSLLSFVSVLVHCLLFATRSLPGQP